MSTPDVGDSVGDAPLTPQREGTPPPTLILPPPPSANPDKPLSSSEDPFSLPVNEPMSSSLQPSERQIGLCVVESFAFLQTGGSGSGGRAGGSSAIDPPETPVVKDVELVAFIAKMTSAYLENVTHNMATKFGGAYEAINAVSKIIENPIPSTFASTSSKYAFGLLSDAYVVAPVVAYGTAVATTALGTASATTLAVVAIPIVATTAGLAIGLAISVGAEILIDKYTIPAATKVINQALSNFESGLGQLERDITALYQYNGPFPP